MSKPRGLISMATRWLSWVREGEQCAEDSKGDCVFEVRVGSHIYVHQEWRETKID